MAITNITEALEALKDLVEALPSTGGNIGASSITGGTFGGEVRANASYQYPASSLLRNSQLCEAGYENSLTNNGEIIWSYE